MMLRLLLVGLLVGGCSGAPSLTMPGKTAREAVMYTVRGVAVEVQRRPQSQADCIAAKVGASMTDAEMQRADAEIAASGASAILAQASTAATSACTK